MSIETQITRLKEAKEAIKESIKKKGVVVDDTTKIDGYSNLIDNIEIKKKVVMPSYAKISFMNSDLASEEEIIKYVNQLDTSKVTNFQDTFLGCPITSLLTNINIENAEIINNMYNSTSIQNLPDIEFPNKIYNAAYLFSQCENLKRAGNITSKGKGKKFETATHGYYKSFDLIFCNCVNLVEVGDIIILYATSLSGFFLGCTALKKIGKIDISNSYDILGFGRCENLEEIPDMYSNNTDNLSIYSNYFVGCTSLKKIGKINFKKTKEFVGSYNRGFFEGLSNLVEIPQYDFSSAMVFGISNANDGTITHAIFLGCTSLSNESLNNILASILTATAYAGVKTLKILGLTETQANTCKTLSNWGSCENAGWTTGYDS